MNALFRVLCSGILLSTAGLVCSGATLAQTPLAGAEAKPRVAVLEFEGIGTTKAEVASATDQMRDDLIKQNRYIVLDRSQTEAVLGELAFQQGGVTDATQAV
ncbi:MAG: hypothetical protein OEW39_01620 [Deltaproteobacteria bacterium]|nr:hypothetical protein [Deltaproteobacteria bacterium]